MTIEVTDAAKDRVLEQGYDPEFGARPLRRAIMDLIEDPLSEQILAGTIQSGDHVVIDVAADGSQLVFHVPEPAAEPAAEPAL